VLLGPQRGAAALGGAKAFTAGLRATTGLSHVAHRSPLSSRSSSLHAQERANRAMKRRTAAVDDWAALIGEPRTMGVRSDGSVLAACGTGSNVPARRRSEPWAAASCVPLARAGHRHAVSESHAVVVKARFQRAVMKRPSAVEHGRLVEVGLEFGVKIARAFGPFCTWHSGRLNLERAAGQVAP